MKKIFVICYIAVTLVIVAVSEVCDKCVKKEECQSFGKLNQEAQDAWQVKFPCSGAEDKERGEVFGFAATAKGDYVCCSNAIWGTTGVTNTNDVSSDQVPSVNDRHADYNNYGDQNSGYDFPSSRPSRGIYDINNSDQNNGWGGSRGDYFNNNGNQNNYPYNANRGNPSRNYFGSNISPHVTRNPFFPVNKPDYNGNQGEQCAVTSFPPAPETGCCGREAVDSDRIIGHQPRPNKPPNSWTSSSTTTQYPPSGYRSWPYGRGGYWPNLNRVSRSVDEDQVTVTIDDRIAGGRETELEQFPWTVLLKVNFDYGDKRAAFNCGGSLISSRYVLSAGHCVYEEGATVTGVDIYLAEYDKRTFPKDCKNILGRGQKCVENVVIKSEEVILHPQYEDSQLKNDVSLIRLQEAAPYTDFIRPICLPSIDIDTPDFSNLRLAVAGWGRNGRYRSDIKQSTIVNLVPQEKCSESYPGLSRRNLCAAGYTGQDTCKGDSGGPLMTVYGGKYQVVGVVSGKRADSPCGTSVPSLYTNVYHYLDWIRNTIKN